MVRMAGVPAAIRTEGLLNASVVASSAGSVNESLL
jgi:hypothetical protein